MTLESLFGKDFRWISPGAFMVVYREGEVPDLPEKLNEFQFEVTPAMNEYIDKPYKAFICNIEASITYTDVRWDGSFDQDLFDPITTMTVKMQEWPRGRKL